MPPYSSGDRHLSLLFFYPISVSPFLAVASLPGAGHWFWIDLCPLSDDQRGGVRRYGVAHGGTAAEGGTTIGSPTEYSYRTAAPLGGLWLVVAEGEVAWVWFTWLGACSQARRHDCCVCVHSMMVMSGDGLASLDSLRIRRPSQRMVHPLPLVAVCVVCVAVGASVWSWQRAR